MFFFERCCRALRNAPLLRRLGPVWRAVTPAYEALLRLIYRRGWLRRVINSSDVVYVPFELRHWTDTYEPAVWERVMGEVRQGDTIADVGAFLGFYTFAFARRVGPQGRVVAFEPDPQNFRRLRELRGFYRQTGNIEMVEKAAGEAQGSVSFCPRRSSESSVGVTGEQGLEAGMVTLDGYFGARPVDLIKIDVEGYEGRVLRGCAGLLSRSAGAPRAVFIEMHPFAWSRYGCDAGQILGPLRAAGYRICDQEGREIADFSGYGWIIATRER